MLNPPHCQTDGSELSVPIHTPGHKLQSASHPQRWETDRLAPTAHTEKKESLLILAANFKLVVFVKHTQLFQCLIRTVLATF